MFDTTQTFGQSSLPDTNTSGAPTQNMGTVIPFGLPIWLPVSGNYGGAPLFQSLLAQGGQGPGAPSLPEGQLGPIVSAALTRLDSAGVDPGLLNALVTAEYTVADLPDGVLGYTDVAGHRVLMDVNGAGHGWFVDSTPEEDEEFGLEGVGAQGRMDLLTVVLHEMGHLAGLGHQEAGLLGETLAPGTRALDALDGLFAHGL